MQTIRNCYMTGQSCSYSRDVVQGEPEGAFVISPFSDDFHYLYDYYVSKLDVGNG